VGGLLVWPVQRLSPNLLFLARLDAVTLRAHPECAPLLPECAPLLPDCTPLLRCRAALDARLHAPNDSLAEAAAIHAALAFKARFVGVSPCVSQHLVVRLSRLSERRRRSRTRPAVRSLRTAHTADAQRGRQGPTEPTGSDGRSGPLAA